MSPMHFPKHPQIEHTPTLIYLSVITCLFQGRPKHGYGGHTSGNRDWGHNAFFFFFTFLTITEKIQSPLNCSTNYYNRNKLVYSFWCFVKWVDTNPELLYQS